MAGWQRVGGGQAATVYYDPATGEYHSVSNSTGQVFSTSKSLDANDLDFNRDVLNRVGLSTSDFKPTYTDLNPAKVGIDKPYNLADSLGAERAGMVGLFDPNRYNNVYDQQQGAISQIAQAAAGAAPSPAELMLQQQAAQNSARGFGLAAALQGRSPGGALRHGLMNQADIQGRAAADAGILRAKEMADARGQLVGALGNIQDQNLGARNQDLGWKGRLLGSQVDALNIGGHGVDTFTRASSANAGASNAWKGGIADTITNAWAPSSQKKSGQLVDY